MTLGRIARQHLRAHPAGVLSTLSRAVEGYPYGSIVPYALDAAACPVLLASRLAEHTRNFTADPRVSLLVHEPGGDPQAEARVTLVGRVAPLEHSDTARARYLARFPHARDYLALDFQFFRVEPVSLRVIAGFARVHWVSREAYTPPAGDLAVREAAIVAQLNSLHVQALRALCGGEQRDTHVVEVIGVDCDGFDVRADGELRRFDFERCAAGADEACAAAAAVLRAAHPPAA
jgi:putative heme iron utilization protein